MNDSAPPPGAPLGPRRAVWALDAALSALAVTTGALLAFGYTHGNVLSAFSIVGRRIAREIVLPGWGDAALGFAVHSGQCLVLGAATALLMRDGRLASRVRAALLVLVAWELIAQLPWFAIVRADVTAGLSLPSRIGLALLLGAALALAPRRENEGTTRQEDERS